MLFLFLSPPQVSLSSGTLSRLADWDTVVLVCGEKHTPVMAGVPYARHSRWSGVHRTQLATSLPFRKRCWQAIVAQKVRNQAECLRLAGRSGFRRVMEMADIVRSGDTGNVESVAAREHFGQLFGAGWNRGGPDGLNAALDYGYAILRAALVRSLTAYGLILSQGVHHDSELNPFNLADDFIEPFRPIVDLHAAELDPPPEALTKAERIQLVELLGCDVLMDGKRQSILRATDISAASYVTACRAGNPGLLKLPALFALSQHRYE